MRVYKNDRLVASIDEKLKVKSANAEFNRVWSAIKRTGIRMLVPLPSGKAGVQVDGVRVVPIQFETRGVWAGVLEEMGYRVAED